MADLPTPVQHAASDLVSPMAGALERDGLFVHTHGSQAKPGGAIEPLASAATRMGSEACSSHSVIGGEDTESGPPSGAAASPKLAVHGGTELAQGTGGLRVDTSKQAASGEPGEPAQQEGGSNESDEFGDDDGDDGGESVGSGTPAAEGGGESTTKRRRKRGRGLNKLWTMTRRNARRRDLAHQRKLTEAQMSDMISTLETAAALMGGEDGALMMMLQDGGDGNGNGGSAAAAAAHVHVGEFRLGDVPGGAIDAEVHTGGGTAISTFQPPSVAAAIAAAMSNHSHSSGGATSGGAGKQPPSTGTISARQGSSSVRQGARGMLGRRNDDIYAYGDDAVAAVAEEAYDDDGDVDDGEGSVHEYYGALPSSSSSTLRAAAAMNSKRRGSGGGGRRGARKVGRPRIHPLPPPSVRMFEGGGGSSNNNSASSVEREDYFRYSGHSGAPPTAAHIQWQQQLLLRQQQQQQQQRQQRDYLKYYNRLSREEQRFAPLGRPRLVVRLRKQTPEEAVEEDNAALLAAMANDDDDVNEEVEEVEGAVAAALVSAPADAANNNPHAESGIAAAEALSEPSIKAAAAAAAARAVVAAPPSIKTVAQLESSEATPAQSPSALDASCEVDAGGEVAALLAEIAGGEGVEAAAASASASYHHSVAAMAVEGEDNTSGGGGSSGYGDGLRAAFLAMFPQPPTRYVITTPLEESGALIEDDTAGISSGTLRPTLGGDDDALTAPSSSSALSAASSSAAATAAAALHGAPSSVARLEGAPSWAQSLGSGADNGIGGGDVAAPSSSSTHAASYAHEEEEEGELEEDEDDLYVAGSRHSHYSRGKRKRGRGRRGGSLKSLGSSWTAVSGRSAKHNIPSMWQITEPSPLQVQQQQLAQARERQLEQTVAQQAFALQQLQQQHTMLLSGQLPSGAAVAGGSVAVQPSPLAQQQQLPPHLRLLALQQQQQQQQQLLQARGMQGQTGSSMAPLPLAPAVIAGSVPPFPSLQPQLAQFPTQGVRPPFMTVGLPLAPGVPMLPPRGGGAGGGTALASPYSTASTADVHSSRTAGAAAAASSSAGSTASGVSAFAAHPLQLPIGGFISTATAVPGMLPAPLPLFPGAAGMAALPVQATHPLLLQQAQVQALRQPPYTTGLIPTPLAAHGFPRPPFTTLTTAITSGPAFGSASLYPSSVAGASGVKPPGYAPAAAAAAQQQSGIPLIPLQHQALVAGAAAARGARMPGSLPSQQPPLHGHYVGLPAPLPVAAAVPLPGGSASSHPAQAGVPSFSSPADSHAIVFDTSGAPHVVLATGGQTLSDAIPHVTATAAVASTANATDGCSSSKGVSRSPSPVEGGTHAVAASRAVSHASGATPSQVMADAAAAAAAAAALTATMPAITPTNNNSGTAAVTEASDIGTPSTALIGPVSAVPAMQPAGSAPLKTQPLSGATFLQQQQERYRQQLGGTSASASHAQEAALSQSSSSGSTAPRIVVGASAPAPAIHVHAPAAPATTVPAASASTHAGAAPPAEPPAPLPKVSIW